jgi:hypothetical protein
MPGEKEVEVINPEAPRDAGYELAAIGHGSCVASKVAGPKFGVAKDANIVMFTLPFPVSTSDFYTALVKVWVRVTDGKLSQKAVLSLSIGRKYMALL